MAEETEVAKRPNMPTIDWQAVEKLENDSADIIQQLREIVFSPDAVKRLDRRWSITQVADILGRTPKTIRQYEADGKLPQPQLTDKGRRAGYSLEEINNMRRVFNLLPFREEEDDPLILAVQNFKGGVGKSTVTAHLSQYLAIQGYRVLVVDADPQASLTAIFGFNPDLDIASKDTLYDFLSGDDVTLRYAIKHSHFDQLDIISANLDLYNIEYEMASELPRTPELLDRMMSGIHKVAEAYDVVLIDPPPALGMLSLSVLRAANAMLVPIRPSAIDYSSTRSFFRMLANTMKILERRHMPAEFKFLMMLSNDFDDGKSAHVEVNRLMKMGYGAHMIETPLRDSAEIDNASSQLKTVYELDSAITSRGTRQRCLRYLNRVCAELELMIRMTWPSHHEQLRELGHI